jgi:hypothetical protein
MEEGMSGSKAGHAAGTWEASKAKILTKISVREENDRNDETRK